jgi:hypothetical protein
MSDKRYLGNIITRNPTAPAGPYQNGAAPGVWSLQEAFTYIKAGLWPIAGNTRRGLFGGGVLTSTGAITNVIQFVNIDSTGNATDFGDLTSARTKLAASSSSTRGVFGGGSNVSGATNTLDFVIIATTGNATDFGDLTTVSDFGTACSSSTRGLFTATNGPTNVINYITIATVGNALDFGDLTLARSQLAGCASPVRGVFGGGDAEGPDPSQRNTIDFVTIATTGNATDFGDLTVYRARLYSCSSSTRGLFAGGINNQSPAVKNIIDYITIASAGNATDFGDLSASRVSGAACSSELRGLFAGGSSQIEIDFVTIATTGNATDFGDLLNDFGNQLAGCSSAHGGL